MDWEDELDTSATMRQAFDWWLEHRIASADEESAFNFAWLWQEQRLRDVRRETAQECIKIGHECAENWGKVTMHHLELAIIERFGLKEQP